MLVIGAAAGLVRFVEASQPGPVELHQADAMSSVNPSTSRSGDLGEPGGTEIVVPSALDGW